MIKDLYTEYLPSYSPLKTPAVTKKLAVYSANYTKDINTLSGENVECFNVNAGGEYSNICDLRGLFSRM
jgi:hypothetical protein